MNPKEQQFLHFWERWKERKWKFVLRIGGIFGLFMLLVFAVKTVHFTDSFDSWGAYLSSNNFLVHILFLGVVSGLIYGLFMFRYVRRMAERIKAKYNE